MQYEQFMEDKPTILAHLTEALKATRQCYDLVKLVYKGDTVEAFFGKDGVAQWRKVINVEGDSGIAMIVDVVKGLY